MIAKEAVVKNGSGLHARPATLLVKKASSFKSDVSIEYNGKKANVKSLIGVLSLAVTKDATIKVVASGDDEALAVEEIVKLVENLED
ncbi:HPr family phosphocarrier protein [Clostridium saccharobutylicum]|uniref:Phosphocarrier protein HPr n=1 Tax=Clostridium saccharobutylicum DSM 13864 TaxID=1345695 RepID=U5MPN2_CLOSA|nr:HPr family phosphocarrier protein [Clostridium saccharobutylicum]AGX42458.1 HPr family phosphocarrier [Clostridium saccharobutylicum DSM 13864]AQR89742.1 phosphocarrier protein HPr [Clostridium saccharobutylicum]AQR99644.1 phosphocarrier protein HPr [Clostridium saccharobutylicum]AQS09374.1 phosphocarrier protein HPr [Clostridium saccharobutylicum]AQS13630.1 phosphocarrier protein HPr [Clostridium saccharobutylicum]